MESPKQHELVKPSGSYPEPWMLGRAGRLAWRFFLGRPMDNRIRTDSTWRYRAQTGYPSRWLRLAGWERAAIRVGVLWVLLAAVTSLAAWLVSRGVLALGYEVPWVLRVLQPRVLLEVHLLGSLGVLIPIGTYRHIRDFGVRVQVPVLEWVRVPGTLKVSCYVSGWVPLEVQGRKAWELDKVRPVAAVSANILSLAYRPDRANRWVTVPRNYRDPDGDPVEVMLPTNFTGADEGHKKRLVAGICNRLGIRDPLVSWELSGSSPRLLLRPAPQPPEKALFAEHKRFFMEAVELKPFLGVLAGETGVYAEMVNDSPHIALSAGTGAGKSELVKALIMQCLRWGWGVEIFDWKEVSQEWAEGLPGVRIHRDIADIHDGLVALSEDLDDRKKAYRRDRSLPGRARVLVVYEEMNATSELLTAYWSDLRSTADKDERRTMPTRSPAIRAQNALVFGGRQFGMFCLFMAQRFSNRVTQGNTDVRECFAIKLLARYSMSTAKILCPEVKPFPQKPKNLGGWVAVMGNDVVTFQGILITDEEAREFAMGGIENPSHPLTTSYFPEVGQRGNADSALGESLPLGAAGELATPADEEPEEGYLVDARKLSEIAPQLAHLGITHKVLRHATDRPEEGFPAPVGGTKNRGYTYDYQEVQAWARRRHAQRASEKAARG